MSNLNNEDEAKVIKHETSEQIIYVRSQLIEEPERRVLLVTRKVVNKKTGRSRLKNFTKRSSLISFPYCKGLVV